MDEVINISVLKNKLKKFAKDRNWEQFHTPKNLSMALSVEASELVEIFQWFNDQDCIDLIDNKRPEVMSKVEDELADIFVYLLRIVMTLDVSLEEVVNQKLLKNEKKYPVDLVKGSSKKYNEYK